MKCKSDSNSCFIKTIDTNNMYNSFLSISNHNHAETKHMITIIPQTKSAEIVHVSKKHWQSESSSRLWNAGIGAGTSAKLERRKLLMRQRNTMVKICQRNTTQQLPHGRKLQFYRKCIGSIYFILAHLRPASIDTIGWYVIQFHQLFLFIVQFPTVE